MTRAFLLGLLLSLGPVAVGCGSDGPGTASDGGTSGGEGDGAVAAHDADEDAALDAGTDGEADAEVDAGSDAGPDAGLLPECTQDQDCDDGLFCNGSERCQGLSCVAGDPPTLDDGAACTVDACDESADEVKHSPDHAACDDLEPCTEDLCGAGGCTHTDLSIGCDDGIFCNGADVCSGGKCTHGGDPCAGGGACANACDEGSDSCLVAAATPCPDDGNPCTDDRCDGAGNCLHPDNSASCDDGTFCNGADSCVGGACVAHAGDPCVGGGECADACDEGADTCLLPALTPCTDDGNVCTDDACDGAGDCAHAPNAATCDDGVYCNGADTCAGGACAVHAGDPCPPGDVCVNEVCILDCPPGTSDCGGVCVDTSTDAANCGQCGWTCSTGCALGQCAGFGDGREGPLAVASGTTTLNLAAGACTGLLGATTVTCTHEVGDLAVGDVVLLHQTVGSEPGRFQYNEIVDEPAAGTYTLSTPLSHAFTTGTVARAQMVKVNQYSDVNVAAGATLTAPNWDGWVGGILAFDAKGHVEADGALSMTARGFPGGSAPGKCMPGQQGYSPQYGPGGHSNAPQGAGGGGGFGDCQGGGGGSNGTGSTAGKWSTSHICASASNGLAAAVYGYPDPRAMFGASGGSGGTGPESYHWGGWGGDAGGLVAVRAGSLVVDGAVASGGDDGHPGGFSFGLPSGGGGGGAGAGGAIVLMTNGYLGVGTNRVTAIGGVGKAGICGAGGTGGNGRILLKASTLAGTSNPAHEAL